MLSLPLVYFSTGCSRRIEYGSVDVLEFTSTYLDKNMRIMVSLPEGFTRGGRYAVLYFIPYGGGGAGLVTQLTNSDAATVRVLRQNAGKSLIIVGVPHDGSFLLDSDPPYEALTGTSGVRFTPGLYESYFLNEVVPRVERDPLLLQLDTEALSETIVYIDTGPHDINREACVRMHQRLIDAGVASELRILSGFHGTTYWQTHMPEYMRFYTAETNERP
ncbi:MAG: hypothetical protein EA426_09060 [Spirochaetaceae bacterium]|nr:MAG: hypothetical protein EA426_09060 [Spirochaetaceae bacterium]